DTYRLLVFGVVLVLQPVTGNDADAVTATATDDRLTLPKPVRVRLGWSTPSDVVMAIYDDDRLAVLPAAALDPSLDAVITQHTSPLQPPSLWVSDQPPHKGDNHD
ncbi:MAG: AbrB/MazE/SpoVT family DNA-binding domain-containing protein, partial [Sulfitobacter sp.]|nr:AbrB/MazE/SpoVT family DNA-binding domain-containing protein [Sulfitobacter sp.]